MRHHEFLVLRRSKDLFAKLARTQTPIHQRHRHRLALALSKRQSITARETGRFGCRALELVDHLAFGQRDRAERHGKTDVLGEKFNVDLAKADLARERMGAAIAAL